MDLERLIKGLDLATKISLVTGADMWSLPAAPEIGLRRLVMSDGPIGVRGEQWDPGDPSIALPSPTALAATWDTALVRRAGLLLAQEARRKGVHMLLAPTLNLHRSPLGGRHFECFSEDPFLTGEIGAAYAGGVQAGGVAATAKHFVANDSETDRFTADIRADERTLRELYLAPFERLAAAGVWAVMAAYNSVNGTTMTEHSALLNDVLKDEWGFDGLVVSDWTATRDTERSALGGLDAAMPGPRNPWGDRLAEAVRDGRVPEEVVDDKVRRVLRLAQRAGALGEPVPPAVSSAVPPARPIDGRVLAREAAARSFVLLADERGLLPLAGVRSLALVGSAAADAKAMGGGSAQVFPAHVVSPLEALSRREGLDIRYALGADPRVRLAPLAVPTTARFLDAGGDVLAEHPLPAAQAHWVAALPPDVDAAALAAVELRATLTPAVSGGHELGVTGTGAFALSVDGHTVLEKSIYPDTSDLASLLLAPGERRIVVELTAGVPVELAVRHTTGAFHGLPRIAFSLGHADPPPDEEALLAEAERVAASADVAVVVVSTTMEVESEGFDRQNLALPGRQDELVTRVAAANPRTIVVLNTGSPVEMPWLDRVAAVLLTWFPGQEGGDALADVLFGDAEPGGRLPTTWPVTAADCPVLDVTPADGALSYDEGVFIGYRGWERLGRTPAFWFGHGLGYTTWSYDEIAAEGRTVTVAVTNTGARPGREVVQLYLSPDSPDSPDSPASPGSPGSAGVERPARWLAAFDTVDAGPGQTVLVTLVLPERAFQIWTDDGWRTVPGAYRVHAARGLGDERLTASLTV
ncbi:glycoside hydrolase family 3 C-terminal domain-containing protein [Microtetraspora sp. NBRC 13810]|uniref:beta-glucosidase family protein n=1 Tax=Microtetraspora sp. NBRC 13810 TaxID=3030990 RepID=UPI002553EAA1|nr:glycoside hydrolase family 3 C-terminal domain-containing protein [Microtetraspora sp. NBRC 13810]